MITVVGGMYREIDFDEISTEIFGSGFRGTRFLLENKCNVKFITSGNYEIERYLNEAHKIFETLEYSVIPYSELITFKYSFPLDNPDIYPSLLRIKKTEPISVSDQKVVCFGMLESDFNIQADFAVYDPQTTINPVAFTDIGKATHLVYIVNQKEAEMIASTKDIEQIKNFFFDKEKALAFIIKKGPQGATLYHEDKQINIPLFKTDHVNKIGSGDIFTASFGYYWMEKNLNIEKAALYASMSTSVYCNSKVFCDVSKLSQEKFKPINAKDISEKQVYLAAPFFSLAELILIDKVRTAFLDFGIKVFSPFHDVGIGTNPDVAINDIEAIKKSDIIFCLLDNYDSGTLIEAGYSLGIGKKIIAYSRVSNQHDLLMLTPFNVRVFQHLTTAIYQTIWEL